MGQIRPKTALDRPKTALDRPKTALDRPKIGQDRLRRAIYERKIARQKGDELQEGILGPFWGRLGAVLRPSWGHLGAFLGRYGPFWVVLGPSWGYLEAILGHIKRSRAILRRKSRNANKCNPFPHKIFIFAGRMKPNRANFGPK